MKIRKGNKMDSYIMLLEPFIAMTNSTLLVMIIPTLFMLLISDFPKTDGNTMFYVQRVGKFNRMFGQILFVAYATISYVIIGVGSSLCGMNYRLQWLFPSAHAISLLHFDEVLNIQK